MNNHFIEMKDLVRRFNRRNWDILIIFWLIIVFVAIVILHNVKLTTYLALQVTVIKSNQVVLLVDVDNLSLLTENKYFYIEDEKYYYDIESINEEYQFIENGYLKEVVVNTKQLTDRLNIEGNVITVRIPKDESSVLKILLNSWKEE